MNTIHDKIRTDSRMSLANSTIVAKGGMWKANGERHEFMAMHEALVQDGDKRRSYFVITRGTTLVGPKEKKPDAVVVVAFITDESNVTRLVLTNEYRLPVQQREVGFPAGLIDKSDFEKANGNIAEACKLAAIREFKEETGLDLHVTDISPVNLYSSAGMTDESIAYVFGTACGTVTNEHLESSEDIDTILVDHSELKELIETYDPSLGYGLSKTSWPFMWSYVRTGW